MTHNVTDLVKAAEPDLKGRTVTYIPTAAIAEEIEGMAEEETRMLEDLGLTDYTGMGLVDFYVVPHLGHPEMGPGAEMIIEKYSSELDLKGINDYQAILVEGDRVSILPESCPAE